MFTNLTISRALTTLLSVVLGFLFLYYAIPPRILIVVLNGAFVGTVGALLVAFWPLIIDTFRSGGGDGFGRVQQMAFGIFTLIIAINVLVLNSVYFRTIGMELPPSPVTAIGRYLSICGMIMIVTAPDYDQSLFYSRDRRLLWASLALGLIIAIGIIFLQESDPCKTLECTSMVPLLLSFWA